VVDPPLKLGRAGRKVCIFKNIYWADTKVNFINGKLFSIK
jgi:hypothetical protein